MMFLTNSSRGVKDASFLQAARALLNSYKGRSTSITIKYSRHKKVPWFFQHDLMFAKVKLLMGKHASHSWANISTWEQ